MNVKMLAHKKNSLSAADGLLMANQKRTSYHRKLVGHGYDGAAVF